MPVQLHATYGRLTAVARIGTARTGHAIWLCRCSCGNPFVLVRSSHLVTGNTRSCGCAKRRADGLSASRTYVTWAAMRRRCSDPKHPRYADYGGRGVRVCRQWNAPGTGFAAFLRDVGERPPGKTLDRIDCNGNYAPGNVRWATLIEQRWNRRDMRTAVASAADTERAHWDRAEAQHLSVQKESTNADSNTY